MAGTIAAAINDMRMLLTIDGPTLAETPLNPILWGIIGVLFTLILVLCSAVVNIVKSKFNDIANGLTKFQDEILKIKSDISSLQHGQEMFNKDLQIKDMQIEQIRQQRNRLNSDL